MSEKKQDPWSDFKPIRREERKSLGPVGFTLTLMFLMAVGGGIGYLVGVFWLALDDSPRALDRMQEETMDDLQWRGRIGAIIGALITGATFLETKFHFLIKR